MTDIQITDLTSTTAITQGVANGTGVFDKLMNSVNLYLDDQYKSGRLKGTDYANVLLGSMQTVLAQSVQFALQEKLLEAQIDDARKGIEVKEQQLVNMQDELLTAAKQRTLLDKDADIKDYQRQFLQPAELGQVTAQTDNTISEGLNIPKQGTILDKQALDIDKGIELKDAQLNSIVLDDTLKAKQIELSNVEIESKTYEKDVLLVDQHDTNVKQQVQLEGQTAEILDSTVRANTQLSDQLLTAVKQRILLDTQEESEQYKVDFLLPKELDQVTAQIAVIGKQEDQLDEQILVAKQEVLGKTYEVNTLLVDQHNTNLKQVEQVTAQIDVAERQMVESETTGLVQRLDVVKGTEVKTQQIANMVDELLTTAKQRLDIDKGIEVKEAQRLATVKDVEVSDYNLTNILPLNKSQLELQNLEVADGTARANTQLDDQLVSTTKDREVKERTTVIQEEQLQDQLLTSSKQRLLLDTEEEAKQYEVDNILPANLQQLVKQIDVTERGMAVNESELADKLVTSTLQRDQLQVQTTNLEIQGLLTSAQKDNTVAEGLNIPKQGLLLDSQKTFQEAQKLNVDAERLNIPKQGLILDSQKDKLVSDKLLTDQQKSNLQAEGLNIPKQGVILDKQVLDIDKGISVKEQQIAGMVDELLTSSKQRLLLDEEIESADLQQTILETEDLLKLAQVGKTKIEADVTAAMGVKDGNLKDRQLANMTIEGKVLEQKVVGRRQSQVISE